MAIDAMRLMLRSVRSGVCEIQCQYQTTSYKPGVAQGDPIGENVSILFDKNQDLYRYDNIETQYTGRPDQMIVGSRSIITAMADWKTTGHPLRGRMVTHHVRSDIPNPFARHREPFATAIVDTAGNELYCSQVGILDRVLDEDLPKAKMIRFERVKPSLLIVGVYFWNPDHTVAVEYEFIIDTALGYAPITVRLRHNGTIGAHWTEYDVTESEWKEVNGVFVPIQVRVHGTTHRISHYEFAMKWSHVNEALDPALFTEQGLSLKDGDKIGTAQGNKWVINKVVGVETPKRQAAKSVQAPTDLRPRVAVLLVVHAALIGGWLYFRRRRKRNPTAQ